MAKIPKQAKKVFSGILFDVYQWPQKMFDGSTETFEMLKRLDTVVVLPITEAGQVLILSSQEQPGRPVAAGLPAGRSEPGEDPLSAAKRELLEETGYVSDAWELWSTFSPSDEVEWRVHYYVARQARKAQDPELGAGERITCAVISMDEFLDQVVDGTLNLYEMGMLIMRQLLLGKRAELVSFLVKRSN
jgi:ADP-ribose pyrophosphatase